MAFIWCRRERPRLGIQPVRPRGAELYDISPRLDGVPVCAHHQRGPEPGRVHLDFQLDHASRIGRRNSGSLNSMRSFVRASAGLPLALATLVATLALALVA